VRAREKASEIDLMSPSTDDPFPAALSHSRIACRDAVRCNVARALNSEQVRPLFFDEILKM